MTLPVCVRIRCAIGNPLTTLRGVLGRYIPVKLKAVPAPLLVSNPDPAYSHSQPVMPATRTMARMAGKIRIVLFISMLLRRPDPALAASFNPVGYCAFSVSLSIARPTPTAIL